MPPPCLPLLFEKQSTPVAGVEQLLCDATAPGCNSFDIWIEAPSAWRTGPVVINVWAWHKGTRQLICGPLSCLNVAGNPKGGRASALALTIRGLVCDRLTVDTDASTASAAAGFVRIIAWACEGQGFDVQVQKYPDNVILGEGVIGESTAILDWSHPIRESQLFAWDADNNNRLVLLSADRLGHLKILPVGSAGAAYAQGLLGPFGAGQFANLLNVLADGRFSSPDLVLAAGQGAELQLTSAGFLRVAEQFAPGYEDNTNAIAATNEKPTAVATYAPTQDININAVASRSVKGAAGNVYGVTIDNNNAAARFFQIKNKATNLAAADVPDLVIRVPATSSVNFDWNMPINFSLGIAAGFSTTAPTFTAGLAADVIWHLRFK